MLMYFTKSYVLLNSSIAVLTFMILPCIPSELVGLSPIMYTSLNQMKDRIEFFYRYYPDPEEEELFKLYAKEMFHCIYQE